MSTRKGSVEKKGVDGSGKKDLGASVAWENKEGVEV
jgi:hypothetical protein